MNEKEMSVDDKRLENEREINQLDDRLSNEKKRLSILNNMQDSVNVISNGVDKCIDLLSKSIKGPTADKVINNVSLSKHRFQTNSNNIIMDQIENTKKTIDSLYQEIDTVSQENRKKQKDDDNNDLDESRKNDKRKDNNNLEESRKNIE